ncbi:MAG: agmatinase family protein [bacterium]|nr:agmatinase family protein [bacterium]
MGSKEKQLENYNPSDVGVHGSIFGLPYTDETADIILLPIPWDVTVSYGEGTSSGPKAILEASPQLDLEVFGVKDAWRVGQYMLPISEKIMGLSASNRKIAEPYIRSLEDPSTPIKTGATKKINNACESLNSWVQEESIKWLEKDKIVGTIGGDHSTPLGLIRALGEKHKTFAILQIDAHMDLRESYEGFKYSHASIMYNALNEVASVSKLVQVGIRDYCQEELEHPGIKSGRIKTFFDQENHDRMFHGDSWRDIVLDIIAQLPKKVYISFDIDGLDPKLCPNTGTPVPGGLEMQQATYLISELVRSKRKIIGFDLSETGPSSNEWDQNVAARMLYRLGVFSAVSNGKI